MCKYIDRDFDMDTQRNRYRDTGIGIASLSTSTSNCYPIQKNYFYPSHICRVFFSMSEKPGSCCPLYIYLSAQSSVCNQIPTALTNSLLSHFLAQFLTIPVSSHVTTSSPFLNITAFRDLFYFLHSWFSRFQSTSEG